MTDERTTTTSTAGERRSDEAEALREFGERLRAFAGDILTSASVVDRLQADTRGRVLDEIAARLGVFGDLAHDARRAVKKMR